MTPMHSPSRFLSVFAVLVLAIGLGTTARAEGDRKNAEPVDVAARIARINEVVTRTTGAVSERQARVITRLNELDAAGATDARLLAAGKMGLRAVREAAERGRREVVKIAEVTIRQLRRQGAEQSQIDQVVAARQTALDAIKAAADAARDAIRSTLTGFGITPPSESGK